MGRHLRFVLGLLIAAGLTGCSAGDEYFTNAKPRLVPSYVCQGDPVPTALVWEWPGIGGRVKVYAANGDLLCNEKFKRKACVFNRLLTTSDVPLSVRVFHDGEERHREAVNYMILSDPIDTSSFLGDLILREPKISTYTVDQQVPVYVRCDAAPNGEPANTQKECTDRIDPETGQPAKDANGNTIRDCVCPNEGRVLRVDTVPVTVTIPDNQSIVWDVSPTWFSPLVQTRRVIYQAGEHGLTVAGPGLAGDTFMNPGEAKIANNAFPGGAWEGKVPRGSAVTHSGGEDDPVPTTDHRLKLTIACAGQ